MKSRRLFIALPVADSRVTEPLGNAYRSLDKFGNIVKTVNPVNLHITMKFLGDVDEGKCLRMMNEFNTFNGQEKISYILKGAGCFPNLSSPSVIWLGIECDLQKMSDFFSRVEDFCVSFGFEKETRRFIPHLTIARIKRGKESPSGLQDFLKSNKERVYGASVFDRLVLFESKLDKTGPEYISLAEVSLV